VIFSPSRSRSQSRSEVSINVNVNVMCKCICKCICIYICIRIRIVSVSRLCPIRDPIRDSFRSVTTCSGFLPSLPITLGSLGSLASRFQSDGPTLFPFSFVFPSLPYHPSPRPRPPTRSRSLPPAFAFAFAFSHCIPRNSRPRFPTAIPAIPTCHLPPSLNIPGVPIFIFIFIFIFICPCPPVVPPWSLRGPRLLGTSRLGRQLQVLGLRLAPHGASHPATSCSPPASLPSYHGYIPLF
jgi:hypothetical protein